MPKCHCSTNHEQIQCMLFVAQSICSLLQDTPDFFLIFFLHGDHQCSLCSMPVALAVCDKNKENPTVNKNIALPWTCSMNLKMQFFS